MTLDIFYIVWLISFLVPPYFEQSLPEGSTDRTTVCQGVALIGSCPSGEVIAVKDVQYGTKLTCPSSDTSPGCCDYAGSDCFLAYSDTAQKAACSGRALCNTVAVGQADTSSCGVTFPDLNHYLTMTYYCVPDTGILEMCSSVTLTDTGSALYFQNADYPSPIRSVETNCVCSIQTTSCTSQIKVYLVHFELDDGGGCTDAQKLQINDTGTIHTLTCSDNTDYTLTHQLTSTSNYITATLDNSAGTNAGRLWIGFEATESTASLDVNCPAVAQSFCIDCQSLSSPIFGSVSFSDGLAYSSQATYSCNNGFNLAGDTTRTCQANATWDGSEPSCQPVACPALVNPTNGAVSTPGGLTFGQLAAYTCTNGYTLNGPSTSTCQADQTWSNSPPTCDSASSTSSGS